MATARPRPDDPRRLHAHLRAALSREGSIRQAHPERQPFKEVLVKMPVEFIALRPPLRIFLRAAWPRSGKLPPAGWQGE